MSLVFHYKRQIITFIASVVLSLALVSMMAFGATYIDVDSVGIATDTPGAALGVKGAALIDGFLVADYITATSTSVASGFGTTSAGAEFAVAGGALFEGGLTASYLKATSTVASSIGGNLGLATTSPGQALSMVGTLLVNNTASSTFLGGLYVRDVGGITTQSGITVTGGDIESSGKLTITSAATSSITGAFTVDSTTLVAEAGGNGVGIATSSFPGLTGDVSATVSVGAGAASTTLFLSGGPTVGASIILRSSDGDDCVVIIANNAEADADGNIILSAKKTVCPLP